MITTSLEPAFQESIHWKWCQNAEVHRSLQSLRPSHGNWIDRMWLKPAKAPSSVWDACVMTSSFELQFPYVKFSIPFDKFDDIISRGKPECKNGITLTKEIVCDLRNGFHWHIPDSLPISPSAHKLPPVQFNVQPHTVKKKGFSLKREWFRNTPGAFGHGRYVLSFANRWNQVNLVFAKAKCNCSLAEVVRIWASLELDRSICPCFGSGFLYVFLRQTRKQAKVWKNEVRRWMLFAIAADNGWIS